MADTREWLTPNSPATPSALGAVIVTVSIPIADKLGMSFKWPALVLSVLLGALIALSLAPELPRVLRSLYWIFNALLVFSVALGVGISVDSPPQPPPPLPLEVLKHLGLAQVAPGPVVAHNILGVGSALAQTPTKDKPAPQSASERGSDPKAPSTQAPEKLTPEQKEHLKQYLQQQQDYRQAQEKYNRRWSW